MSLLDLSAGLSPRHQAKYLSQHCKKTPSQMLSPQSCQIIQMRALSLLKSVCVCVCVRVRARARARARARVCVCV